MSIAFLIGVFAVFIAIVPHFVKQARARRSADPSGDGGATMIDSGSSSASSACGTDGSGGSDGGCD